MGREVISSSHRVALTGQVPLLSLSKLFVNSPEGRPFFFFTGFSRVGFFSLSGISGWCRVLLFIIMFFHRYLAAKIRRGGDSDLF